MRRPAVAAVVALLVLSVLAVPVSARDGLVTMTTRAAIDDAIHRGAIDSAQAILEKAYSVYAPWRLSPQFQPASIDKCGLPTIKDIDRALPTLPQTVVEEIRGLRARPVNTTYIDTAHFRIHYDTSGTHKIYGWPSTTYRDAIASAAEASWTYEVTTLGFRQPPSDGSDPDGGGGNALYDIYVRNLSGVYGYTQGSYTVPSTPQNDVTSFVVIDNDYAGFGYPDPASPMQVTVAHEFCHACQFAHDYDEAVWYMECTSTWMEDQVFGSVNDYVQYVPYFYNTPYRSLEWDDGNVRIYGSCVWDFLLAERNGNGVIPAIWYQLEGTASTLLMIDSVLSSSYGTSIEEEFTQFSIWNWFTGTRNDGNHYSEAASWPLVTLTQTYTTYPIVDGAPSPTYRPDHYAANYVKFSNPNMGSGWDGLHVAYDGPIVGTVPNSAYLTDKLQSGATEEYGAISLGFLGNGQTTVQGWDGMDEVCLVVANLTDNVNDMNYIYDVDEVDTGVEDEPYVFGMKSATPNPFTDATAIACTVPTWGGVVHVAIYDVSGREVVELVNGRRPGGEFIARWDGRDASGESVASGVYFATLDIDGRTASGKLVVVK
jgi:hypothetical protein